MSYEEANKFAAEKKLKYFETSAKFDKNIKKSIASLLETIIESKTVYNSLSSNDLLKSETGTNINNNQNNEENNEAFQLDPKKVNEESWYHKFCKIINPFNWFKKK